MKQNIYFEGTEPFRLIVCKTEESIIHTSSVTGSESDDFCNQHK